MALVNTAKKTNFERLYSHILFLEFSSALNDLQI